MNEKKHIITINERNILTVSSVDDVISFDDTVVNLSIGNVSLMISGSDLSVTALSVENGNITVTGKIDAVVYTDDVPKKRFGSRFFKS